MGISLNKAGHQISFSNPMAIHIENRKDIVIAYVVSIVLPIAFIAFIFARKIIFDVPILLDVILGGLFFLVPLILIYYGWTKSGRLLLAWLPTLILYGIYINGFKGKYVLDGHLYDSMKIFLIGFAAIPFLILSSREVKLFLIGISLPVIGVIFNDYIMNSLEIGSRFVENEMESNFNTLRSMFAYVMLSSVCFSMRYLMDRSDRLNERLFSELEEKNNIIQEQAESKVSQLNRQLLKYNRELTLLNVIKKVTIYAKDEQKLLKELCTHLVTRGNYPLAWIGKASEQGKPLDVIIPLVSFGAGNSEDYLKDFSIDMNDEMQGRGPTATALRKGNTTVVNQIMDDLNFTSWKSNAEKYEFGSSITLCITVESITQYVLCVYASQANAFDDHETSILERIAYNVGNAINSIHAVIERDKAKQELQLAYERLNYHVNNTPLAVLERDGNLTITSWNKRAEELSGWKQEEVLGKKIHEFLLPTEEAELRQRNLLEVVSGKVTPEATEGLPIITRSGKMLYLDMYYSVLRNNDGSVQGLLSFASDRTEQVLAKHQLRERIKEITLLYGISQLLAIENPVLDELLQQVAQMLPQGWQYPEVCKGRIVFSGKQYTSPDFFDTPWHLKVPISINDQVVGSIEVIYTEVKPIAYEGPFLLEELNLLHAIGEMLSAYVERKREEDEFKAVQANLSATINNTEILIWSIDRNHTLLMFNEPLSRYFKTHHDLELKLGMNVLNADHHFDGSMLSETWAPHYHKSLEGEVVRVEETINGMDLVFSLSPVFKDDEVIGVSVFATNVTEQNIRDRQLLEARHKISELKTMALRSVMNPHFMFNVFNSIQFFIIKNDRLNAIEYLSVFSNLIRSVVTHSLSDRIKLTEELALLKNYVQLEQMRFENKFAYTFVVEDDLDTDSVNIPSLLIQPFIENAILHGLNKRTEPGSLWIRVKTAEEFLIFEVEDNGIGREAAARLRTANCNMHKSMGTRLTEQRLREINQTDGFSVIYTDLYSGDVPAGTLVTINIKYI